MNYPHPLLAREGWPFIGLAAVASLLLTLLWGWQAALPAYIVLVFVVLGLAGAAGAALAGGRALDCDGAGQPLTLGFSLGFGRSPGW